MPVTVLAEKPGLWTPRNPRLVLPTLCCPRLPLLCPKGQGRSFLTVFESGWARHQQEKELESFAGRKAARFVSLFRAVDYQCAGSAGRGPGSAPGGWVRGDLLVWIQGLFRLLPPSQEAPAVLVCQRMHQLRGSRALCPLTLGSPRPDRPS